MSKNSKNIVSLFPVVYAEPIKVYEILKINKMKIAKK